MRVRWQGQQPRGGEGAPAHSLGREIADNVGQVAAPEGRDALLRGNTGEAVHDARVALDLAGADLGVRVLRLDDQLDALDGSRQGLSDSASDTYVGYG